MIYAVIIQFLLRWLARVSEDFALCSLFLIYVESFLDVPERVSCVWPSGPFQCLKVLLGEDLIIRHSLRGRFCKLFVEDRVRDRGGR
jgi:hypothetical protein